MILDEGFQIKMKTEGSFTDTIQLTAIIVMTVKCCLRNDNKD